MGRSQAQMDSAASWLEVREQAVITIIKILLAFGKPMTARQILDVYKTRKNVPEISSVNVMARILGEAVEQSSGLILIRSYYQRSTARYVYSLEIELM